MKVLVTGASGFLGRHLLATLPGAGHEVVGLCRRPERLGGPLNSAPDERHDPGSVTLARGDVRDAHSLLSALVGVQAVIHCAGGVSHRAEAARSMHDLHVRGTETLLRAAKAAGVVRFVHLSSSGTVAVGTTMEVRSEAAPRPLATIAGWPYYRAKLFAEERALAASDAAMAVVCLNPSLLLGPPAPAPWGDGAEAGAADEVLGPLLAGTLPLAPAGGIAFVDVRDVATACVRALTHGHPGRRYLLNAANWSFFDFYGRAARIASLRAPAATAPRGLGRWLGLLARPPAALPTDPAALDLASHCFWADATRARDEVGFGAREPLETLTEALDFAQRARSAD